MASNTTFSVPVQPTVDVDGHIQLGDEDRPHPSKYPAAWLARHATPIARGPLCPSGAKLWRADSLE